MTVTRDVAAGEPRNSLELDVPAGTVFYTYTAATWGCIDDEGGGRALCLEPGRPFFEFPADAVKEA